MSYTKEQSLESVKRLVDQFDLDVDSIKFQKHTKEAQVEDKYIKPLFSFLNWNVTNNGLRCGREEFKVQASLRIKGNLSAPDYVLQLPNPDTGKMKRWMFIEAKHPKFNLAHDLKYAKQAYKYAHSTINKSDDPTNWVRLALLTDFEEFRLFDCVDNRPLEPDKLGLLNQCVVSPFDWQYHNYVKDFNILWDTFEKSQVAKGSLMGLRVTPEEKVNRRTLPDERFLSDLEKWRKEIASSIFKANRGLSDEMLTAATQLIINRLVSVKVLSDRAIEDDFLSLLLNDLEKNKDETLSAYDACQEILQRLDRTYNGSIFARREELDSVTVENKVLKKVLNELRPDNTTYTLASMPVEIIGNAYERFLGNTIRRKGRGIAVEEKPEVRKAKGVYYTPRYIVDYIVEHTVGELLKKCKTPEDVSKLKILDPACGSGSFLLGAYEYLLKWHQDYFEQKLESVGDENKFARKYREHVRVYRLSNGDQRSVVRLRAKLKKEILVNNIFGVDIDPQAVEVAQFSLSMKALENAEKDELDEEVSLFSMKVLPDLSGNIKCGNSLIDFRCYDQQPLPFENAARINAFDWKKEFTNLRWNSMSSAFSVVLGNPPYVDVKELSPKVKDLLYSNYETAKRRFDLYIPFTERAISLLHNDGLLGFIIPSMFMRREYGEPLRNFIKRSCSIVNIVDFGTNQIFTGLLNYVAVLVLKKGGLPQESCIVTAMSQACLDNSDIPKALTESKKYKGVSNFEVKQDSFRIDKEWYLTDPVERVFCERLFEEHSALETLLKYASEGIHSGKDEVFFIPSEKAKELVFESPPAYPLAKGKDAHRYEFIKQADLKQAVIFPYDLLTGRVLTSKDLESNAPHIWKYLKDSRGTLKGRGYFDRSSKEWYELWCPRNPELYTLPKIVGPEIAIRGEFTLIREPLFINNKLKALIPKSNIGESIYYLLGLLNSKLITYLHKSIAPPKGNNYFEVKTRILGRLPIRRINFSIASEKTLHSSLVALVNRMLELNQEVVAVSTTQGRIAIKRQIIATDDQIDHLVYELYGLTDKEIEIVEKGS